MVDFGVQSKYRLVLSANGFSVPLIDEAHGLFGGDIPMAKFRLNKRLNRPSEAEIVVPRYDQRGRPLYVGSPGSNIYPEIGPVNNMLTIYREGKPVFSGYIVSIRGNVDDPYFTFLCKDASFLLEKAFISPTYATSSKDIFGIARDLYDQWITAHGGLHTPPLMSFETRTYTSIGSGFTSNGNIGKSISARYWQHEYTTVSDALSSLAVVGGDGFQFDWYTDLVATTGFDLATRLPTTKMILVAPYAYYRTHAAATGKAIAVGPGSSRTIDKCTWEYDGSDIATEFISAGYGSGTMQQRYATSGNLGFNRGQRLPLQSRVDVDATIRTNAQAQERATSGRGRFSWGHVSLHIEWRDKDYGGKLNFDELQPGLRVHSEIKDSFGHIRGGYMYCTNWTMDVSQQGEKLSADLVDLP